ncbi:MAG TPA: hypothetical protein VNL36_09150 [Bacteroidota bacterium]|nr:hypothetical protein [Bacteroidota bacterium]
MAKKTEPEYLLRIYPHLDERTNENSIVLAIETLEIFTSFRYEILLEDKREGNTIELKIVGLHAPAMLMPGKGPARGSRSYTGLKGRYAIRINKMDKEINEFQVEFTSKKIKILDNPNKSFIIARVDPLEVTKA